MRQKATIAVDEVKKDPYNLNNNRRWQLGLWIKKIDVLFLNNTTV